VFQENVDEMKHTQAQGKLELNEIKDKIKG
jgi:hypothetical protein